MKRMERTVCFYTYEEKYIVIATRASVKVSKLYRTLILHFEKYTQLFFYSRFKNFGRHVHHICFNIPNLNNKQWGFRYNFLTNSKNTENFICYISKWVSSNLDCINPTYNDTYYVNSSLSTAIMKLNII